MKMICCEAEQFYHDFFSLIIDLDCGDKFCEENPQHVEWMKKRIHNSLLDYGTLLGAYSDDGLPIGFIWYKHDTGLEGVGHSGKCAHIRLFGLFEEYRGNGIGTALLNEACRRIKENGGECLYVDTYRENKDAVAYYVKQDFFPVAQLPGLNGIEDDPQTLLYKVLE